MPQAGTAILSVPCAGTPRGSHGTAPPVRSAIPHRQIQPHQCQLPCPHRKRAAKHQCLRPLRANRGPDSGIAAAVPAAAYLHPPHVLPARREIVLKLNRMIRHGLDRAGMRFPIQRGNFNRLSLLQLLHHTPIIALRHCLLGKRVHSTTGRIQTRIFITPLHPLNFLIFRTVGPRGRTLITATCAQDYANLACSRNS